MILSLLKQSNHVTDVWPTCLLFYFGGIFIYNCVSVFKCRLLGGKCC